MTSPPPGTNPIPGPLLTPEQYDDLVGASDEVRIAAASAKIRSYCRWHVGPALTETVVLDGRNGRVLPVPSLLITEVAEVLEDGTAVEVEWSSVGLLRHPQRWTKRWRGVQVTLTHGFDPVPAELARIVADVAARLPEPGMNAVEKVGPFEYAGGTAFTPDEIDVLNRYRLPVVW